MTGNRKGRHYISFISGFTLFFTVAKETFLLQHRSTLQPIYGLLFVFTGINPGNLCQLTYLLSKFMKTESYSLIHRYNDFICLECCLYKMNVFEHSFAFALTGSMLLHLMT